MSQLVDKLNTKGKIKRIDIAGIHNKHFINLINIKHSKREHIHPRDYSAMNLRLHSVLSLLFL